MGNVGMAARPFGSVLVAGALCVGLFGCGGQQAQEPSGAESSQTSEVVIYDERPYQEALDAWASGSGDTTPHDDSQKSQEIQQAIESVIAPYKGSVSVVVSGVNGSDLECAVDAEVPRTSASMIKLAILATLFDAADSRTLSLDETVTTTSADMVGGTGSIQSMGAGSTFTLEELAGYMISDSDNTATNLLIDRLGMDAVNTEADKIGLDQTVLERKMMDEDAMAAGQENYTSAEDVATVLRLVAEGRLINQQYSDMAKGYLLAQSDVDGLLDGVPEGVDVAHKTGTLTNVEHDGGIVYADEPYVIVVMTEGVPNDEATTLIGDVSAAVYEAMAA